MKIDLFGISLTISRTPKSGPEKEANNVFGFYPYKNFLERWSGRIIRADSLNQISVVLREEQGQIFFLEPLEQGILLAPEPDASTRYLLIPGGVNGLSLEDFPLWAFHKEHPDCCRIIPPPITLVELMKL